MMAKVPLGATKGMHPMDPARATRHDCGGFTTKPLTPFWVTLPRVRPANQLSSGDRKHSFSSTYAENRVEVASQTWLLVTVPLSSISTRMMRLWVPSAWL